MPARLESDELNYPNPDVSLRNRAAPNFCGAQAFRVRQRLRIGSLDALLNRNRVELPGGVGVNQKVIANFRMAFDDSMCREFEDAPGAKVGTGNRERPNQFSQADNLHVLIQENYIDGEEHTNRMDGVPWNDPDAAALRLQGPSSEKPDQPRAK